MPETIHYVITCAKYDKSGSIVETVGQHRWLDDGRFEPQKTLVGRSILVTNIDAGLVSYTVYQKDNQWHLGGKLVKFKVGDIDFLRTDGKKVEVDSLGDLPQC